MTAMRSSRGGTQPAMESEEPLSAKISDPELIKKKKKKKNKEKRKRSLSRSTESSSCSSSSKKHKKKKRHGSPEPLKSKITPIFLRTQNDTNNTIVSVVCEDYLWNRIKLTKTNGNWRAIPRTEPSKKYSSEDMLVKKSASETPVVENEETPVEQVAEVKNVEPSLTNGDVESDSDVEEVPYIVDQTPVALVDLCSDVESDDKPEIKSDIEEVHEEVREDVEQEVFEEFEPREESKDLLKEEEITEEKERCQNTDINVDENHNDFDNIPVPCEMEHDFCQESVDSKGLEFLLNELQESELEEVEEERRASEAVEKVVGTQEERPTSPTLMDAIDDLCHGLIMNERLNIPEPQNDNMSNMYFEPLMQNEEEHKDEKEEKEFEAKVDTPKSETKPDDSPINLVVQDVKEDEGPLNACELEELDILWRLPVGTTIHHSKAPAEEKVALPAHQPVTADKNATISLVQSPVVKEQCSTPIQEEPLNLGIPKPDPKVQPTTPPVPKPELKYEDPLKNMTGYKWPQKSIKNDKCNDSKLLEMLNPQEEKGDPLAQLKEILNDPDVAVPDPLLVPRGRLQALIANPAKEIPKLLKQSQPKLPILDPDFLVVSLSHLQYILQNGYDKESDAKLYQQAQLLQSQLSADKNGFDAAMLNQMLWLPYLSPLDLNRQASPQELLAMMMSYNYPWQQTEKPASNLYSTSRTSHVPTLQQWHGYSQKSVPNTTSVPRSCYSDFYKTPLPPAYGVPRQMGPPQPPIVPRRSELNQRRSSKHSSQPLRSHSSWTSPKTSEASRIPNPHGINLPPHPQQASSQQTPRADNKLPNTSQFQPMSSSPQPQKFNIKVKDHLHLVDPNLLRPSFLKYDEPQCPPPGFKLGDQHPNLWHPLFSSQEGKNYTTPWHWTTPVTISGE